MNWIINNKEWIFSGIGVAIISLIISLFRNKIQKLKQPTTNSITNTGNTGNVSVNVEVNTTKEEKQKSPLSTIATPEQVILTVKETKRYLRRRCRYTPEGSREFKKIITELTTLRHIEEINSYDERIRRLKDDIFEKPIANAVYNENLGNLDNMANILEDIKLKGKKESVRLLFLGIAYEKLDRITEAIECYKIILEDENDIKLRKSAQFNILLCKEKNGDKSVDFTKFFDDKTILFGSERIKDKALAMHIIVCQKDDIPFQYKYMLQETLKYEQEHDPLGYVKTLLSYNNLKTLSLTQKEIDELIEITIKKGDINSRVAILVNLHNQIPSSDVKPRLKIEKILDALQKEYSDYSIKKYIKVLN